MSNDANSQSDQSHSEAPLELPTRSAQDLETAIDSGHLDAPPIPPGTDSDSVKESEVAGTEQHGEQQDGEGRDESAPASPPTQLDEAGVIQHPGADAPTPTTAQNQHTEGSMGSEPLLVPSETDGTLADANLHDSTNAPPTDEDAPTTLPSQDLDASSHSQDTTDLPAPSATLPTSHSLLNNPSITTSNPGSRSSTPTGGLAPSNIAPPPPSSSPVPTKKFASSLSVNKKFLEKAGEKAKPEAKASIARPSPTLTAPTISTSHPRLLTGKITATPAVSLTTASANPVVTGWLKTVPVGEIPRPTVPQPSPDFSRAGGGAGTYERGGFGGQRGFGGFGNQQSQGRSGSAVWGSSRGGHQGLDMGIGGDFPTAAEAANAKNLRAQQLLEQMQSRDRAVQARAAATAAANAHLLEGLDAFRGIHLDPNASHWDEMGDEDNDFLDDTIEFGDGTQYKIDAMEAAPVAAPPAPGNDDDLREPHPSDFATLEAPLGPGEAVEQPSREERFKDDYDRSWPRKPVTPNDSKNLFNDRLGKFEPYAGTSGAAAKKVEPTQGRSILKASATGSTATNDLPPHLDRGTSDHNRPRKESITSPRAQAATLPSRKDSSEARGWGRSEWRDGASTGAGPRRPSMESAAAPRRTSIEHQSARRPSIDQSGRQLPPHLMSAPSHDRHDTLPIASTTTHVRATATVLSPTSDASHPLSPPRQRQVSIPPVAEAQAAAVDAPSEATPPAPVDLEELHAREMHAAAARAKERRQKEEEERIAAQKERAKKKAAELEEKLRLEREAKAALAKPAETTPAPTSPTANGPPSDRADSWRKAAPPPVVAPAAPVVKPQPTQILARNETKQEAKPMSTRPPAITGLLTGNTSTIPTGPRIDQRRNARTPSDAAKSRQPPPHLSAPTPVIPPSESTTTAAPQQTSKPKASVESTPAVVKATSLFPEPSAETTSSPVPASMPSPTLTKLKRLPETSGLDEVMLRIKAEMAVKREAAAADSMETMPLPRPPAGDVGLTVKLPPSTKAAPPTPTVTPEAPQPATKDVPKPRGRPDGKKPATAAMPPSFVSYEPMPSFETTRRERSLSPRPVWKVYAVRLAMQPTRAPAEPLRLLNFHLPSPPSNPDRLLTFDPPIKGLSAPRMSRDDHLLLKQYKRGVLIIPVAVPSRTIIRRTTFDPPIAVPAPPEAIARPPPTPVSHKARDRAEGGGSGSWRKQDAAPDFEEGVEATTAPTAAALFEVTPTRPKPAAKSKLPAGSSIAFYSPNGPLALDDPASASMSRSNSERFMVTSELNGEVVEMVPRESLAAPGADLTVEPQPLPPPDVSFETPSLSRPLSPPSGSGWQQGKATPLSLSALDPTGSSVWSAPPIDGPVHSRSISLGASKPFVEKISDSILDDDDFPPPIPASVAELKSEDEGVNEKHSVQARGAKDEARLRAAAPSFSSYVAHPMPAIDNRYTAFPRSPSQQSMPQPAHSPLNYHSQPFQPQTSYAQQLPASYYPISSPSPSLSQYTTQAVPAYSLASYSPIAASPSAVFGYRTPSQGITNPALIAQQGYGGSMSSFGAVGAPVARNGAAYGLRPVSLPPNGYASSPPYLNGTYRSAESSSYAAAQEQQRSAFAAQSYSGGLPSPSYQPQPYPSGGFPPGAIGRRTANTTNTQPAGYGGRPW